MHKEILAPEQVKLLDLVAIKAYEFGWKKWREYVDFYFVIKIHYSVAQISSRAKELFEGSFSEANFREQLHYFERIDYSEPVHYLIPSPPSDDEVREFLRLASLQD